MKTTHAELNFLRYGCELLENHSLLDIVTTNGLNCITR
jgi:tRNA(Arg) A34 adenosine deaminase TadA